MRPKPPPLPDLPPAVPPAFRLIATETIPDLEFSVNEAIGAGLKIDVNPTNSQPVGGLVIVSQPCSRDPQWDKRVRTRLSTQKVINNGGVW